MKKLFKSTSRHALLTFLALCIYPSFSLAKMAVVHELKGKAFLSLPSGEIKELAKGAEVNLGEEVILEENASAHLLLARGGSFHINQGAQVRFTDLGAKIIQGSLWYKFYDDAYPLRISTSNSEFRPETTGEAVLSFDSYTGKSQALSIRGDFVLSNKFDPMKSSRISTGQFSFVDLDIRDGHPRPGTAIGKDSYKTVIGQFSGVKPLDAQKVKRQNIAKKIIISPQRPQREVASVKKARSKQKVIPKNVTAPKKVNAQKLSPSDLYSEMLTKTLRGRVKAAPKKVRVKRKATPGKITILRARPKVSLKAKTPKANGRIINLVDYSSKRVRTKVKKKQLKKLLSIKKSPRKKRRSPASSRRKKKAPMYGDNSFESEIKGPFERSLQDELRSQRKHSQGVEELIDELRSVDEDYDISY